MGLSVPLLPSLHPSFSLPPSPKPSLYFLIHCGSQQGNISGMVHIHIVMVHYIACTIAMLL